MNYKRDSRWETGTSFTDMGSRKRFMIFQQWEENMRAILASCIVSAAISHSSFAAIGQEAVTQGDHLAAGMAAASPDFPGLKSLCTRPSRQLTPALVKSRPWRMPKLLPSAQVFDNLYFVGNAFSSAWLVKTEEGLVLIDTLHTSEEAKVSIEEGMQQLGLDPNDLRYIVISHGHGDHYGGAQYLADKYDAVVVMSTADWKALEDPADRIDVQGWAEIPTPDMTVDTAETLVLGKTKIQLNVTPSHTPGTISTIFTVYDNGTPHKAVLWGGTGFNFGPVLDQYYQYARSAEAMRQRVLSENIEIFLSNHVARDNSDRKIQALADRPSPQSPHPFIFGSVRTSKAFEVFRECALQQAQVLENKK